MHKPNYFRGQLVIRESDGASIPLDPSNPDYAAFVAEQELLPAGQRLDLSAPAPVSVEPVPVAPLTADEIGQLRAMLIGAQGANVVVAGEA